MNKEIICISLFTLLLLIFLIDTPSTGSSVGLFSSIIRCFRGQGPAPEEPQLEPVASEPQREQNIVSRPTSELQHVKKYVISKLLSQLNMIKNIGAFVDEKVQLDEAMFKFYIDGTNSYQADKIIENLETIVDERLHIKKEFEFHIQSIIGIAKIMLEIFEQRRFAENMLKKYHENDTKTWLNKLQQRYRIQSRQNNLQQISEKILGNLLEKFERQKSLYRKIVSVMYSILSNFKNDVNMKMKFGAAGLDVDLTRIKQFYNDEIVMVYTIATIQSRVINRIPYNIYVRHDERLNYGSQKFDISDSEIKEISESLGPRLGA